MNANRLFEKLVDLTAIRDIELLEFSLLRTIYQYLHPLDLRIFRLDHNNVVQSEIIYGKKKCTVKNEGSSLTSELKQMMTYIGNTDSTEFTQKNEQGYVSLYKIHQTRNMTLYLFILNQYRIPREIRHLLIGVLEIFRNYVELLAENITDSLTGLLNRKSFDRTIDKVYDLIPANTDEYEDDKRKRDSNNYWLVMADIDDFKLINDQFGHLYGDDVLILMAKIIRNCCRDDDLIFRFGGEEFVMIIKCADIEDAKLALNRLLDSVASHLFPQVGTVTISVGAVQVDRDTFSATLLDYADQALYHSKQNGKNQLNFFEELVEQGIIDKPKVQPGAIELFEIESALPSLKVI